MATLRNLTDARMPHESPVLIVEQALTEGAANGSFVPNVVYRGSLDNVGFRATIIAASVSEMKATAARLLLQH